MSPKDAKKNAQEFLKNQAAIIKKYGGTPKLSGEAYRSALNEVAKTFTSLAQTAKKATA